ncbi:MAG: hypothetical protein KGS72_10350 [Cyanobacteria bacterium REEB67]|nr:hypothetical protein [Cyanobacteria bacterium REEB67]
METPIKTTENFAAHKQNVSADKGKLPSGYAFAVVVVFKIALMVLFSSGYMDRLFVPFIGHFLAHFDNTWDFFYRTSTQRDQFPYQPLMLYILAFFCLPLNLLGWQNPLLVNFFIKLPTLLSDILITCLLIKMFPNRTRMVFWYYFLSPIILYACYMHSQLDLIPTAILFAAAYYLRQNHSVKAAFLAGLALATKTHIAAALPLFGIYLFKNQKPATMLIFTICLVLTELFFLLPFIDSPGFQALVIHNPKQKQIFESSVAIGSMQIFLPIFAVFLTYGRFALYQKINRDLFDAFMMIVFAFFVLLIVPAPGWYVWIAPYLSLFMIKYSNRDRRIVTSCFALNVIYLLYFVFFHRFDYVDLLFCNHPLSIKFADNHLTSVAFTILEVVLLANIALSYRIGVRSNSNYKRDKAVVIGIGGDSGAGKSTLLHDLKSLLHGSMVELEGDADHKWARGDENWNSHTHLDPKANFLHKQADVLFDLKRGRPVERADYDHSVGAFTAARLIKPKDFVVICGLHTFYLPKARKAIDLKIFMDPESSIKMRWKLLRDKAERGYTEEQIEAQLKRRKTDVDKFIAPQREFADLCIRYYTAGQNDEGEPKLGLKVSLSSSIHLDRLVQELTKNGQLLDWDYSENLSKQDLTLSEPVSKEVLQTLAQDMIPNLEDLVTSEIHWQSGLRGFVQLIILLVLNDLMKEKEEINEN